MPCPPRLYSRLIIRTLLLGSMPLVAKDSLVDILSCRLCPLFSIVLDYSQTSSKQTMVRRTRRIKSANNHATLPMVDYISSLPELCIGSIMQHLPWRECIGMEQVNKRWRRLALTHGWIGRREFDSCDYRNRGGQQLDIAHITMLLDRCGRQVESLRLFHIRSPFEVIDLLDKCPIASKVDLIDVEFDSAVLDHLRTMRATGLRSLAYVSNRHQPHLGTSLQLVASLNCLLTESSTLESNDPWDRMLRKLVSSCLKLEHLSIDPGLGIPKLGPDSLFQLDRLVSLEMRCSYPTGNAREWGKRWEWAWLEALAESGQLEHLVVLTPVPVPIELLCRVVERCKKLHFLGAEPKEFSLHDGYEGLIEAVEGRGDAASSQQPLTMYLRLPETQPVLPLTNNRIRFASCGRVESHVLRRLRSEWK